MAPRPSTFDRSRLELRPLAERVHGLAMDRIRPREPVTLNLVDLVPVAKRIRDAQLNDAAIILMMGAHVLRAGVQRYLADLLERGVLSCIAMNGAGVIHDYEFARIGATTESVARYIRDGRFGLWRETGEINDIVSDGARRGLGLGECVGQAIAESDFPHKDISILATAYRLGTPVTVHVGIGYDIVHEHPNCDGAAYGATSYRDFLRFASVVERLSGGVLMNFGSAVMGPEVFLKALAMARNAGDGTVDPIADFTTLVCDLVELGDGTRAEPGTENPAYYFRPWKTLLVRTLGGTGESFYLRGRHEDTIPQLWTALERENPR